MFNRVSTANNQFTTIDSLNRRQASLAELQRQISSGVKYDNYAQVALDGETRRVVGFESAIDRTRTFQRNNQIMQVRLQTVDKSIASIADINKEVIAVMTQERSAVGSDVPLTQILKGALVRIQDQLNVNLSGRYLFAGSQTDTPAVDSLLNSNLNDNGVQTDSYYLGDNVDLSQKVSNDVTIQYNVRANEPVFQKLIGAIHLAIRAEANHSDSQLADAFNLANEAQKELTGLRSNVDTNLKNLDEVGNQHNDLLTYYRNTLGEVTGTDVAETSIQLSLDQAVLTASFQAFARVSSLTLGQYLR